MFCYGIAKLCICFIHGVAEVVGVEGHDYVNGGGGRGATVLVDEGLPKERELPGRTASNNNLTVLLKIKW